MNLLGIGGGLNESRKKFYREFLEFARRHPQMRVSLYIPRSDLNLLASEGCFSIARSLSDLCLSGRLVLTRKMPRPGLLATLRAVRGTRSAPVLGRGKEAARPADFHPNAA